MKPSWPVLLLTFLAASAPLVARADDKESQRLFEEGRQLLTAHKYQEAMEIFQRIHAAHPSVGALFNIAESQERLARPVAAWASYRAAEALAIAKDDPRRAQAAAERSAAMEAFLPRLVVTDPPDDLTVSIQEPIPRAEWNGPLRRAVGQYELVARASCRMAYSATIVIPDDARPPDVVVPRLATDPKCLPPAPPPASKTQRTIGFATTGVGIALVGVGVVFGLLATSTRSDLVSACGGSYEGCSAYDRGRTDALNETARSRATWSTISVVAGLALVAGGIITLATSPKTSPPSRAAYSP